MINTQFGLQDFITLVEKCTDSFINGSETDSKSKTRIACNVVLQYSDFLRVIQLTELDLKNTSPENDKTNEALLAQMDKLSSEIETFCNALDPSLAFQVATVWSLVAGEYSNNVALRNNLEQCEYFSDKLRGLMLKRVPR